MQIVNIRIIDYHGNSISRDLKHDTLSLILPFILDAIFHEITLAFSHHFLNFVHLFPSLTILITGLSSMSVQRTQTSTVFHMHLNVLYLVFHIIAL